MSATQNAFAPRDDWWSHDRLVPEVPKIKNDRIYRIMQDQRKDLPLDPTLLIVLILPKIRHLRMENL